jgi:hypothetical protein
MAFLPGSFAFFQAGVVQFPTAPQDMVQRPLLLRGWHQLVFEGFVHRLCFHIPTFCLIGGKVERVRDIRSLLGYLAFTPPGYSEGPSAGKLG